MTFEPEVIKSGRRPIWADWTPQQLAQYHRDIEREMRWHRQIIAAPRRAQLRRRRVNQKCGRNL